MLWLIITLLTLYFLRGRKCEDDEVYYQSEKRLDEEAFSKTLQGRSEKELWELRNKYHEQLVKAEGTIYHRYYLDCIGVIDKQIYSLRHQ